MDKLELEYSLTPAECTMHFGVPVVPEEYMMKSGWLKGSCSNVNSASVCPAMKSSNKMLYKNIQDIHVM